MTRPFRLTFSGTFVRTTLMFPRAALLHRLGAAERFLRRSPAPCRFRHDHWPS
jgi:hypothetical protein